MIRRIGTSTYLTRLGYKFPNVKIFEDNINKGVEYKRKKLKVTDTPNDTIQFEVIQDADSKKWHVVYKNIYEDEQLNINEWFNVTPDKDHKTDWLEFDTQKAADLWLAKTIKRSKGEPVITLEQAQKNVDVLEPKVEQYTGMLECYKAILEDLKAKQPKEEKKETKKSSKKK